MIDFPVYRPSCDQPTFSPSQLHDWPIMLPCPVAQSVYHTPQLSYMVSLSFFHADYMISLSCSLSQSHEQFIVLPNPAVWLAYHVFHADCIINLSCFPCRLHDQPIMFPFPVARAVYHSPHPSYVVSPSCFPCKLHDQPIMFPYPVARSVCHAPHPSYVVSPSCFPCKLYDQLMFSMQTTFRVFHANYMISLSCFFI